MYPGTSEDFDSISSIEVPAARPYRKAKAKESKKPRHFFVICLSCLFRSHSQAKKMIAATIPDQLPPFDSDGD
jgi:hypothetical protein